MAKAKNMRKAGSRSSKSFKQGRPKRGKHSKKAILKSSPIYAAFSIVKLDEAIAIKLWAVHNSINTVKEQMTERIATEPKFPKIYLALALNINAGHARIVDEINNALHAYNSARPSTDSTQSYAVFTDEQVNGIRMTILQQLTVLMSQILSKSL